jgi:hypothetical protein
MRWRHEGAMKGSRDRNVAAIGARGAERRTQA